MSPSSQHTLRMSVRLIAGLLVTPSLLAQPTQCYKCLVTQTGTFSCVGGLNQGYRHCIVGPTSCQLYYSCGLTYTERDIAADGSFHDPGVPVAVASEERRTCRGFITVRANAKRARTDAVVV